MDYIRSLENADASQGGCFLCQAVNALNDPQQLRQRRVLWHTPHTLVMMNKFPYTNGHLMVAPLVHIPAIEDLDPLVLADVQIQTAAAIRLLKKTMNPQGYNIGINQGRCAGAGHPSHLHQHIVPRWGGDVNFISVIGQVRVQPQAMDQIYEELMAARSVTP